MDWLKLYSEFDNAVPVLFGMDDAGFEPGWTLSLNVAETGVEVCIGAWALLLSRCSGERWVTLGYMDKETAEPFPVRLEIDESLVVRDFLNSVRDQLRLQLEHADIGEEQLRRLLELESGLQLYSSTVQEEKNGTVIISGDNGMSEETVGRVASYVDTVLDLFRSVPEAKVKDLVYLPDEELQLVTEKWNPAASAYPEQPAHRIFEETAAAYADRTALVLKGKSVSYGVLNERANQLAHYLKEQGVGPGGQVALMLERSEGLIQAVLAVLKCGASYIPFDPDYPRVRIKQMLDDVSPQYVLVNSNVEVCAGTIPDGIECIQIDRIGEQLQSFSRENPEAVCTIDSPAYIMFTSGSTGQPKGVEVVHRGIVRLVCNSNFVPLNQDTVLLHMAAASFDASTFEIWGALLNGGCCVLCETGIPTIDDIGRLIADFGVNTLWMTAALFNLVIMEAPEVLKPVRYLLIGGEALSPKHVEKALNELPDTQLINGYGPTENTTFSTTYAFDRTAFDVQAPIPIGYPIANSTCYILDVYQRPVPVGVRGELYVGGDGVARGYVNRPELTAERFLPDPFSKKTSRRIYRTGDLAYWNRDGSIGFVGRVDNQVKLRGFRIELSEIDATLSQYPDVEQAVTVVVDGDGGSKWLAAYVKVERPEEYDVSGLLSFARENLPDYMVPSRIVPIKEWNYTPAGKLSRTKLPRPWENEASYADPVQYAGKTEETVATIYGEVLGLKSVGPNADFFELGGIHLRRYPCS
ncbi:amino acid adenylation domain-containing protein [Verrucomicrobia bacterium S94]|nr:amino acid adenylation domain-containing protein [Verrucomicrobia bacterium S94]